LHTHTHIRYIDKTWNKKKIKNKIEPKLKCVLDRKTKKLKIKGKIEWETEYESRDGRVLYFPEPEDFEITIKEPELGQYF